MLPLSDNERIGHFRNLCLTDLYWLLRYGLGRQDIERQWLLERCREVQAAPFGYLDLWAREHYKSTIITFGHTIFELLNDPELTIGLFSHSRPHAKGFLRQIKQELERNEMLKAVFDEVLWQNPAKESPKWSEDDGIVLRRKGNPKESSVEAWGLVDGQPIGKHFARLKYDDVVVRESVSTPEMIAKTTEMLELSYALGAIGGERQFIGTRYHYNDSYRVILERGTAKPRLHKATLDGQADGEPVLMTRDLLGEKRRDMGPYVFAAQMMQDPTSDKLQGFRREWIKFYDKHGDSGANKYLLVDAASEKRPSSDYTAMWVVGLGSDRNYYVLDIIRDRLSLTQRADAVFRLHRKWRPLEVRYEKYGLMADVGHIRDRQDRESYHFDIVEVAGQTPKNDRIKRLVPSFEQGRWWFPRQLSYTDYEHKVRDLVHTFIEEEYCAHPVAVHDDMFDALARIAEPDLPLIWPQAETEPPKERYRRDTGRRASAWAA